MKENYFEFIDTKEKAYWLGVLYTEAYMETRNQKPYRLRIQIGNLEKLKIISKTCKKFDS
ncbi:MAG TPA: hypothetical protein ENH75_04420 [archaeon]|nr:hypothetical protein [archaeon]